MTPVGPVLVGYVGGLHVLPLPLDVAVDTVEVSGADEVSIGLVLDVEGGSESADVLFAQPDAVLLGRGRRTTFRFA